MKLILFLRQLLLTLLIFSFTSSYLDAAAVYASAMQQPAGKSTCPNACCSGKQTGKTCCCANEHSATKTERERGTCAFENTGCTPSTPSLASQSSMKDLDLKSPAVSLGDHSASQEYLRMASFTPRQVFAFATFHPPKQ